MIEKLLGEVVDHEEIFYSWLKDRWIQGITFDQEFCFDLNKIDLSKPIKVLDLFKGSDHYGRIVGQGKFRGTLFQKGFHFLKHTDPLIVTKTRHGLEIKLLDSKEREESEKMSLIFDSAKELEKIKHHFMLRMDRLKINQKLISLKDYNLLLFLNMAKDSDFIIKPTLLKDGEISFDPSPLLENFVKRYKGNMSWPENYGTLQEYQYFYGPSQLLTDPGPMKDLESNIKELKEFWSRPLITQKSLDDLWERAMND